MTHDARTTPPLDVLAARMLEAARKAGADSADALAIRGESISVDMRGGKLERAERSEGIDIGLRVLIGQRQACVSASDASDRVIAELAERAVAMAREAPADPFAGLAEPGQLAKDHDASFLELSDPSADPLPAELMEDARRAEAAARGTAGISQVDQASAGFGRRAFHLAASNGFSGGYERSSRSISCVVITGTGSEMERDWASESRVFLADLPDPESIGKLAAERTLARRGAVQPPTGTFPVLFDERVAGSLIGHLLSAINGTSIARGSSWLRDALGAQILPEGLDLLEDPWRARISGSRPFDAEGLPTARRALVRNGILQGWVLDLASARKLGLESTANAARGTAAPPSPTVSNVALTQGPADRAALIRDMGRGLLVTSMIGATINPTTGDYSRGASGFWIENGEITRAVNECTIAGNLREILRRIIPANDARLHQATVVPSLLAEGLTIAGA